MADSAEQLKPTGKVADRLQQNVDKVTDPIARDYLADQMEKFLELRRLVNEWLASIEAGRVHDADEARKMFMERYRRSSSN